MHENNIVFLNIINREGQLNLKNEQYIKKNNISKKTLFVFFLVSVFFK